MRHAQILDRGRVETSQLTEHQGRAHKLAVEPGSPHIFYSCGEDGVVNHVSCSFHLIVLIVHSAVSTMSPSKYL